jgi:hypothetical protein
MQCFFGTPRARVSRSDWSARQPFTPVLRPTSLGEMQENANNKQRQQSDPARCKLSSRELHVL